VSTGVITTRRRRAPEPRPLAEYALLGASLVAVAAGFADPDRAELSALRAGALLVLPLAIAARSLHQPGHAARRGLRAPLWVPALLTAAAVGLQAGGGVQGVGAPLPFLAAGAGSLQAGGRRALPWVLAAVAAVLLPGWLGLAAQGGIAAQIAFALGMLLAVLLPGEALQGERASHDRTRARLRAVEDESAGLRHETGVALPALRTGSWVADADRDLRSIARDLQADMDRACHLLLAATPARLAAVYRPDGAMEERLVVVARAGDDAGLIEDLGKRDGIVGAAFKAGAPVCLARPRPDDPRVVHRVDTEGVGAVLAVPLTDGEQRWGVVLLDADEPTAFDGPVRDVAADVADFVAGAIAKAVEVSALREDMRENHAFYEACREVSGHVRIDDIAHAVVGRAGEFVPFDCAALALIESEGECLRVVGATGFHPEPPTTPFYVTATEGLLAQAVRHRTVIDRVDLGGAQRPPILFGRDAGPARDLSSLLVLPVPAPGHSEPLGALVVARRQWPDFEQEDVERLEVLLTQVGASLSNGRLFAEHETRGVTDGMTGLPNHRRFQEVLGSKIAASNRTGMKLSLLLMDIDRFKSVNDTYGHPMGDEVIKRLATVLKECAREGTDLAARYGGEEFVLLLDGTDGAGAEALANRIRQAFAKERYVFTDDGRPRSFACTVSIGVATWPEDADAQAQLIEHADQALYCSKEGGRDRVTRWSQRSGARTGPGAPAPRAAR
jgi:diguanylate cyclase (GGDEF)-like protein